MEKNLLATQLNQTHNNNNNNIIRRNTLKPRNIYECIIVFLPHLSIEMSNNYVFLNERNLVQTSFVLFHFFDGEAFIYIHARFIILLDYLMTFIFYQLWHSSGNKLILLPSKQFHVEIKLFSESLLIVS